MTKINRNAPCPCGSGRKYKQCCMRNGEPVTQFTTDNGTTLAMYDSKLSVRNEAGIEPELINTLMTTFDRDTILDEEKHSDYLWCLHCGRTYKRGEFRLVRNLQMCPYQDCEGDTVIDAWNWEQVRDNHPEYPEIPEIDEIYHL